MIGLLHRPEGATIEELAEATGWQSHSVRGVMSGALKKKLGLAIASEKVAGRAAPIASRTMAEARPKSPEVDSPDNPSLQAGWTRLFGRPAPKGMSRRLLQLAAAYQAQARIHGGLKPAVRRRLLQAARSASGLSNDTPRRLAPASLSPGSRLIREWHGRSHMAEVTEDGFLYEGHRYQSLSSIARRITGARWSGRRFFGL